MFIVEEDMLRQIIGVFFQAFPVGVDGAQEQIQVSYEYIYENIIYTCNKLQLADIQIKILVYMPTCNCLYLCFFVNEYKKTQMYVLNAKLRQVADPHITVELTLPYIAL